MVPPGRGRRGRPRQRWMDCVNRDIRAIGTTKDEIHDRTDWRRIIIMSAATTLQLLSGMARRRKRFAFHAYIHGSAYDGKPFLNTCLSFCHQPASLQHVLRAIHGQRHDLCVVLWLFDRERTGRVYDVGTSLDGPLPGASSLQQVRLEQL